MNIQREDVIQVANAINIKATETKIEWVLLNYESYQEDDQSSNWSEVVENMLQSVEPETMGGYISDIVEKNTAELSVNEYHFLRNEMFLKGVALGVFTNTDANYTKFDNELGDLLNVDY